MCQCLLLKAIVLDDDGLGLNIPLGVLSGHHKHCLHNEELESPQFTSPASFSLMHTHTLEIQNERMSKIL